VIQSFGAGSFNFCLFKTEFWPGTRSTVSVSSSLFEGAGFATAASIDPGLSILFSDVQFFDCNKALMIIRQANLVSTNGLSGTRNTIGVILGDGDNEATGEITFCYAQAADLPNLLGTTTPIQINGIAGQEINLAWTGAPEVPQVPFDSDRQEGTGTLESGVATITARNANLRRPMVTRDTPNGTPMGQLVVASATRLAGSFVVESLLPDTAARAVADQSTFSWSIPPMARKIVIHQGNSSA
jgi:hypothetical protein